MWKWLIGAFVVFVLALSAGGYYLYSSGELKKIQERFQPGAAAVKVRFTPAVRGDLVRTVSAPGQIEPKTRVQISAQVSAKILALPFRDEGMQVKKGDVLVRLEQQDLAALLDSAKAQLKSEEARLEGARAGFATAQIEFNRRKELYATKDISKAELDQAEETFQRTQSQLRVAEHSIEIARANIKRAEKDLGNTTITAPFDGTLTKRNAEEGETVVVGTLNNPGSVIMEVADLNVMVMKTRIDEANIAPIRIGQKASVYINAYPDTVFTGTVTLIGLKRIVDRDGTAYFETEILIDKPPELVLRSGLTANADIQVETFRDVVKVPSQAVLDRAIDDLPKDVIVGNTLIDRTKKYARVVFTTDAEGKTKPIPVKTGASDLTDTIIMAGLEADTPVISGPFKILETLKAGQKVEEDTTKPGTKTLEAKSDETKQPPGT
ncbi:MAG: efflux RND transporter periplasmic adaptor subunit [Phycisphaerae bacterium]|nr:efflux RND transporter periplasmic adaptor subunit [Phycisphaerae bacterium]